MNDITKSLYANYNQLRLAEISRRVVTNTVESIRKTDGFTRNASAVVIALLDDTSLSH